MLYEQLVILMPCMAIVECASQRVTFPENEDSIVTCHIGRIYQAFSSRSTFG
jgi:hypothetical protein